MSRLMLLGIGSAGGWTPVLPTADGGLLPHTWMNPEVGLYQDIAETTPAVADGDPVAVMKNQGSDAYQVTQAGAGAMPTLKLNILNSHPILRYDGGDYLQGAFAGGLVSQPYTIFCVAQLAAAAVDDGVLHNVIGGDDNTRRIFIYQSNEAGPDLWAIYAGTSGVKGTATNANWNTWTVLFNGVGSQFWHNGVSQDSGDAGTNGIDGLDVGADFNGGFKWIGDIAEVLIYTANLSDADKNQVGQYLADKFGLAYTEI